MSPTTISAPPYMPVTSTSAVSQPGRTNEGVPRVVRPGGYWEGGIPGTNPVHLGTGSWIWVLDLGPGIWSWSLVLGFRLVPRPTSKNL